MLDERQETLDAVSSTVAVGKPNTTDRAAALQVIQRITSFHATPLPDAVTLSTYNELIPNGGDRILSLVEREAEHRQRQASAETRHAVRGHWMAYTLAILLSVGGIFLGMQGHDWLAAAVFTTTIGAVVAALVVSRESKTEKRPKKPA